MRVLNEFGVNWTRRSLCGHNEFRMGLLYCFLVI